MSRSGSTGVGERICALLLLLVYPPTFRRRFGAEMLAFVRDRRLRLGGCGPLERLLFWWRTTTDLVRNAPGLWWRGLAGGRSAVPPTRLAARPNRSRARRSRGSRRDEMLDSIKQDLTYTARRLIRAPGFTATAVLILALGIGANTAIFSLVNAFLIRPQPFAAPDELVDIYQDSDDGTPFSTSYPAYRDMTGYRDVFAGVLAALLDFGTLSSDSGSRPVTLEFVTSSYFPVLGLRPFRGRVFETAEDDPGGAPAAIVSHRAWRLRLGSDPDVVGRTVRLNGAPVTVVGIAPASYGGLGPGLAVDFWLSISALGPVGGPFRVGSLERREDHPFLVKARLRPGVTVAQAQAAMDGLATRLAEQYPELNEGRDITVFGPGAVRLHPRQDGYLYPAAGFLMAVVALVLVIACSNLANLLLVRGASRERELALRAALGASRGRLVRHLLSESLSIALAGGGVGWLLAAWGLRALARFQPPMPFPIALDLRLDLRVLAFALALSLVTGLAFGLLPALRASRPRLVQGLRSESSGGKKRFGLSLRSGLLVAQIAVSLVLLVGAGLLLRSLRAARSLDLGFATARTAMLQTDTAQAGYDGEETVAFYRELRRRLEARPEVDAVALTSRLPLSLLGVSNSMVVEGYEPSSGTGAVELASAAVDPAYFETLEIPLVRGRGFLASDDVTTVPVAVVSEALAKRYWGTTDVLGRRLRHQSVEGSWIEVVGVVGDVKVHTHGEAATPIFYRPWDQVAPSRMVTVVRGSVDAAQLLAGLREAAQALDPEVPIYAARTMEQHLGTALFLPRAVASLLVALGAVAVALASLGLYAVVAFSVSQRTAEVGLRLALGARRAQVVAMVLRETFLLVLVGLGLGLVLSRLAAPALSSLLYGVPAGDPLTYGVIALLLAAVVVGAAALPASRAARADPVRALRCE